MTTRGVHLLRCGQQVFALEEDITLVGSIKRLSTR